MIIAHKTESGAYIARRYCTRIAQHLEAFHAVPSRYGFSFPGARIEADSVDALNAALRRAGWRKVWA
ncbi:hypothetical protein MAL1_00242 [Bacteriophage DSS3_MAL1]|nr:hypothetical protein MAL1_00242 [Bacteriophage DSS3_MAL1]